MTWAVDHRWSPGSSGEAAPVDAPAAYAARWIDMGDYNSADVVWDRQGLAYNDDGARDRLVEKLRVCGSGLRTPSATGLRRDETTTLADDAEWHLVARRAGGYIYVDAWLLPGGLEA